MSNVVILQRFRVKRDLAANFTAANTMLLEGEFALETDTRKMKIGDGATAWNDLDYIDAAFLPYDNSGSGLAAETVQDAIDELASGGPAQEPAVSAYLSAAQALAGSVAAKVMLNAENFDTDNCFNTTTGVFTPTQAGKYLVTLTLALSRTAGVITAGERIIVFLYKNGASFLPVTGATHTSTTNSIQLTALVDMNGTTDYLEMYARRDTTATYQIDANQTSFSAIRISG